MLVQTHTGRPLTLGQEINRGGEARIWTVQREPQQLAKLYFAPTPQHEAKLHAMLANPPRQPRDHTAIAWPTEVLYQNGGFVGFLMPRVHDCNSIFRIYNPMLRSKLPEIYPWNAFLHRTARNLAAALELIHARNHVVGDLNESNILVTRDARVTLVDADSFQVRAEQGVLHHCTVAKAEFLPPELSGADLKSVERTAEQDHFGLAVLIWYLLMEGFHPFQGVLQRSSSIERVHLYSMERGLFPYHHYRIVPPPKALSPVQLHPGLANAFVRAFVDGHGNPAKRPDAKEWQLLLTQAENELAACTKDKKHYYYGQLRRCPVCHPLHHRPTARQWLYGRFVQLQEQFVQPWPELPQVRSSRLLTAKARSLSENGAGRISKLGALRPLAQKRWEQARPALTLGAQWSALNVAGAAISAVVALCVWFLLTKWTAIVAAPRDAWVICGVLFGLLLGDMQWRLLARHTSKWAASRAAWVGATGGAGLLSALSVASPYQPVSPLLEKTLLGDIGPLVVGLVFGLLLGLTHWLLLHYHLRRKIESRAWIMSSVAGWGLAGQGWLGGQAAAASWSLTDEWLVLAASIAGGLIGVMIYGLLTSRWLYQGLQKSGPMRHSLRHQSRRFGAGFWQKLSPNAFANLQKEIKRWGWNLLLLALILTLLQGVLIQL